MLKSFWKCSQVFFHLKRNQKQIYNVLTRPKVSSLKLLENWKNHLQFSILVVWTRCKYVSGFFWLEKTPGNTFRTIWAPKTDFFFSRSCLMALSEAQVFFIFSYSQVISKRLRKWLADELKKFRNAFQTLRWTSKNTLHIFKNGVRRLEVNIEPF